MKLLLNRYRHCRCFSATYRTHFVFVSMITRSRRFECLPINQIYFLVYDSFSLSFPLRTWKFPYTPAHSNALYFQTSVNSGIRLEIGPGYQSLPSGRRPRGRVAPPRCSCSCGADWIPTNGGETGRHPCITPQGENLNRGEL